MHRHVRACALASAVILTALTQVRAETLDGVQPAALDQPQINMIVYLGANSVPQVGLTTDPLGSGGDVPFFNVQAYLDTGASSILVSTPTAGLLSVGTESVNGVPVIYADVGVGGGTGSQATATTNYNVSQPLRLQLAPYIPGQTMDNFLDTPANTVPDLSPYTIVVNGGNAVRVQVGPYVPPVDTTNVTDPIDQLIQQLLSEGSALDVVGMPAIRGHVMVIDPTGVKATGQLFTVLGQVLAGGDISALTDADLAQIDSAGIKTYLYDKATAPTFNAANTNNPGIPTAQRHVALSYASFERFSQVTLGVDGPATPGLPAPNQAQNPFIGKNPVALMQGQPAGDAPGITITRTLADASVLPSTGNWLLDTGAAASIISENQAALLHVKYDREHGNGPGTPPVVDPTDPTASTGGATPLLVDSITGATIPDQFTLVLGGIGGQEVLAGFWLDSLKLPTEEATLSGNDALNIYFTHVPVLVGNITVADPTDPTKTLTLDGVFGMNMLIESINLQTDAVGNITDLGAPSPSFFQWITIDLTSDTSGELGLVFDPETVPGVAAPEPVSLAMLALGAFPLLLRRRRV